MPASCQAGRERNLILSSSCPPSRRSAWPRARESRASAGGGRTAMVILRAELEPVTAPGRRPRFRPGERICPGLLAREQLSRGRRTECWLAWSVPLWSHVVVKLPCERHMDDLRDARRLGREARTLRRLAHPSIQRLLEDAHGDPVPHLVLEHVEGPTLARQLRDAGHLPAVDVVRIGMQLAACLHYLHGQGMVHLDIKPDNVALQDGRAVLLDFDVARRAGRAAPPSRSLGTHAYRA